jgi:hypothetical protein
MSKNGNANRKIPPETDTGNPAGKSPFGTKREHTVYRLFTGGCILAVNPGNPRKRRRDP